MQVVAVQEEGGSGWGTRPDVATSWLRNGQAMWLPNSGGAVFLVNASGKIVDQIKYEKVTEDEVVHHS